MGWPPFQEMIQAIAPGMGNLLHDCRSLLSESRRARLPVKHHGPTRQTGERLDFGRNGGIESSPGIHRLAMDMEEFVGMCLTKFPLDVLTKIVYTRFRRCPAETVDWRNSLFQHFLNRGSEFLRGVQALEIKEA